MARPRCEGSGHPPSKRLGSGYMGECRECKRAFATTKEGNVFNHAMSYDQIRDMKLAAEKNQVLVEAGPHFNEIVELPEPRVPIEFTISFEGIWKHELRTFISSVLKLAREAGADRCDVTEHENQVAK